MASSTLRPARRRPGAARSAPSTLQGRLPKELRLARIGTLDGANRSLSEVYIAAHNALFAMGAEQEDSAFVADAADAWRETLSLRDERTVGQDNTVKWQRLRLQLPPSRLRPHFVRATVRGHKYLDGTLAVFLGPHRLADYDASGTQLHAEHQAA